ncbi:hypothetical protein L1049_004377 [Liquidambar formosana]|uniref:STM1-like N-terminal domain-containing protein n=1 Tax=Liquidambar formosana TaxID=63359 RepID=A0AAP0RN61_LIQFO
MARQGNFFALLDDEEGEDLSTLIQRVAAKVDASSPPVGNKQQQQSQSTNADAANLPSNRRWPSDSVRGDRGRGRGRGRGGRGRGSGGWLESGGNEVEQFGNDSENGYQSNYRGTDGYHHRNYRGGNYGEVNGNQQNYGGGNSYRGNYGRADGNKSNIGGDSAANVGDDNRQWRGRGRGGGRGRGRGRGMGFDENNGLGIENEVVVDQQIENQGQDGGDGGGWEQVSDFKSKVYGSEGRSYRDDGRPFRNGNWRSGGDRRGYGGANHDFRNQEGHSDGGHDGSNGKGEVPNNSETREVLGEENGHVINGNNSSDGAQRDAPVTTEIAGDIEPKQEKHEGQDNSEQVPIKKKKSKKKVKSEQVPINKKNENSEQDSEEEHNYMTLEEYEKEVLSEKRKALEALKKPVERKITLDKDFESMQLVEKKNEVSLLIQLKPEKDKPKKKDSLDKEEKVRKSVSINEFLKPAEDEMPPTGELATFDRGRGWT